MNGSRAIERIKKILREFLWTIGFKGKLISTSLKGHYGEWFACQSLVREGYILVQKNWRSKLNQRLEIDLIFKDINILVFVEVRARSSGGLVSGYDSINRKKLNILKRAFIAYLRENKYRPDHYRFDIVEVDLPLTGNGKPTLFHHENIAIF
jgi:putative endonuclease